ncbi:hypothetical protein M2475_001806 [Breznakia sp. PF5-3]|uniref:hypothetical protein n=1 Tax=unclassified Breznakia TaxID=2623764 RepID=UPI002406A4A2|nr:MULTISPECIES: hypothetical protein [unclassified Breznakia]MDF9825351.1 hypothetical protein [Breznakia sp. PM6-1]MDF9836229.1 hypothetical protein [Breznakia sp. PF5-3]MDF9838531.1 hypothetical protein [Breznakia sp. PFB2-8]MDF9860474.1 hypothetical protein [Breznakia sp. PH5-24]
MYKCLVCGYLGLYEKPYDKNGCASYEICPCCGFQFGFDDKDQGKTFESYRIKWISDGAQWSNKKKQPRNWSLEEQLKNL